MKKICFLFALTLLLGACASARNDSLTLYDLGPLRAQQDAASPPALPPLAVADVNAPAWLDSPMMFYRLAYANGQQPRPYANSRWNTPPAQLFVQRLKARIGQAGGAVLSASDGAVDVPVLRIEADDFMQIFDSPGQSAAQVAVRVSVLKKHTLLAHKAFGRQVRAPSPDAAGGARALAEASDAVIADIIAWLAGLPLKT
jgi:cholesterol transport system auxiliary component